MLARRLPTGEIIRTEQDAKVSTATTSPSWIIGLEDTLAFGHRGDRRCIRGSTTTPACSPCPPTSTSQAAVPKIPCQRPGT